MTITMTWIIGAILYLLIGLFVFLTVLENNHHTDSRVLFALAAPFIIIGYPYFLMRRVIR